MHKSRDSLQRMSGRQEAIIFPAAAYFMCAYVCFSISDEGLPARGMQCIVNSNSIIGSFFSAPPPQIYGDAMACSHSQPLPGLPVALWAMRIHHLSGFVIPCLDWQISRNPHSLLRQTVCTCYCTAMNNSAVMEIFRIATAAGEREWPN